MYIYCSSENKFLSSPKHTWIKTLHYLALNIVPTIFSKNVYESDSEDLNFLLSQLNAQ